MKSDSIKHKDLNSFEHPSRSAWPLHFFAVLEVAEMVLELIVVVVTDTVVALVVDVVQVPQSTLQDVW